MTSFVAGDPGVAPSNTDPSFVAPGAAPDAAGADDTTVVLELNGRKFTKADLVKKLTHADTHIERLNERLTAQEKLMADANELLKKQLNGLDLLTKIKDTSAAPPAPPASPATLTRDDVVSLLSQRDQDAAAQAAAKAAEDNWTHVTTTLTKALGATVDQRVRQVAAENDLTLAEAVTLAKTKPKAFLALFPDLKPVPQTSLFGKGSTTSITPPKTSPKTGFFQADLKQSINIMQAKLKEAGL